jgi:hypothetical protein
VSRLLLLANIKGIEPLTHRLKGDSSTIELYVNLTEDVLDKWARNLLSYTIPHTLVGFRWYYLPSSCFHERARPLLALRAARPWLPTSDYCG